MFYSHMICLLKFPCYLYLDPIVCLDDVDQMFKHMGNYFLLRALITSSMYGNTTKGTAGEKAGTLIMEESTGI